jgi:hypothetical protein
MDPINLTQTIFAPLGAHLLDLVAALEGEDIPLILVGGFGLFLRQEVVLASGEPRLYADAPSPRATEDFDIVLKLNLLADVARMQRLRDALEGLDYKVVASAQEYQFVKPDTAGGRIATSRWICWQGNRKPRIPRCISAASGSCPKSATIPSMRVERPKRLPLRRH